MIQKRPVGVLIIGCFYTAIGGFTTFLLIIAILDSLRFHGVESVLISTPASFLGFLLYGVTPILFYLTGANLIMSRPWARKAALFIIPAISLLLIIHIAFKMAVLRSQYLQPGINDLLTEQFELFSIWALGFLAIFAPVAFYLTHPKVAFYFSCQNYKETD